MNQDQLSFIGSASKLGQVELNGYQVLHAPGPVSYFSQVWLNYLIFHAFGFLIDISSLMNGWICKLSM